ncbi:MAG: sulfotransferase, partial [Deltaproteobacteria bacterium]|nr:sulfotransferase [Deltaproteobacteria bacterium]
DSTTYLASRPAPERIARLAPRCRLIALLRDPIQRAWSHYWHGVATGRATQSFERTLRDRPGNILRRGFYAEQLERYLRYVPQEQLKVLIFEEFIRDPQRITDEVCAFLGLPGSVDLANVDIHRNAARAPLSLRARLLLNATLRPLVAKSYHRKIPFMPGYQPDSVTARVERHPWFRKAADRFEDLRPRRRYPPMQEDTRAFLAGVFRRRNAALPELLGRELTAWWPWMGKDGTGA